MSGYGGGFENYDAGFAKVSIAWIGGTTDQFTGRNDYIGDLEDTDKNNFDFRLNDIDLGIGRGNVWLNYSKYRLSATELDLTSADGWSAGFWLNSEFGENTENMAIVQYGTGVAANFNSYSPSLRTGISREIPEGTDVDEQRRLRLMNVVNFDWGESWSAQAVAIYQHDDLGLEQDSDLKWYSIGLRPVYSFSELYNLAFEAGYDYTDLDSGEKGGLLKLTVFPDLRHVVRRVQRADRRQDQRGRHLGLLHGRAVRVLVVSHRQQGCADPRSPQRGLRTCTANQALVRTDDQQKAAPESQFRGLLSAME